MLRPEQRGGLDGAERRRLDGGRLRPWTFGNASPNVEERSRGWKKRHVGWLEGALLFRIAQGVATYERGGLGEESSHFLVVTCPVCHTQRSLF